MLDVRYKMIRFLVIAHFLILSAVAEETKDSVRIDFREVKVNLSEKVNLREWRTFRGNDLVHEYSENDIARDGTFAQTNEIFYHAGEIILHISTLEKRRVTFFRPSSLIKVVQLDEDGDELVDQISFSNQDESTVNLFTRQENGRFAPVSDKVLNERRSLEIQMKKTMEAFDAE